MGNKKFENKTCIYCGAPARSVDHIPPRSLFRKTNRHDLVRVPSCKICNEGFSKDDEFWQWAFMLREEATNHADASQVRPNVFRAIDMPEKKGLVTTFFKSMEPTAPEYDQQDKKYTYTVESDRIYRFLTRLVRALYFHETNIKLPDDYEILVFPEQHMVTGQSTQQEKLSTLWRMISSRPLKEIGNGVFRYKCAFDIVFEEQGDFDSLWWMQFYDDTAFLCITQVLA